MSKKTSTPIGIVGRLTLTLLIAVSILTVYSGFVAKYSDVGGAQTIKALSKIFRDATEFKPVLDENNETLYYEAFDDGGALIGFGFSQTGRGMWGDIQVAGGIDLDYRLVGVSVLEQGETPGLGARIVESRFLNQFKGLGVEEIKLEKYDGKVDAISGATISSRSVTDIIRSEVERVSELREAGDV